jgi:sigma-B regulation protein RsbU (phosphoserine phosphatase)
VLDQPILRDADTALSPGDCLVLYTDGVTDAYSETSGATFGDARLRQLVADFGGSGASEMTQAIVSATSVFAQETPQFDDQTLLVVKRRGT